MGEVLQIFDGVQVVNLTAHPIDFAEEPIKTQEEREQKVKATIAPIYTLNVKMVEKTRGVIGDSIELIRIEPEVDEEELKKAIEKIEEVTTAPTVIAIVSLPTLQALNNANLNPINTKDKIIFFASIVNIAERGIKPPVASMKKFSV